MAAGGNGGELKASWGVSYNPDVCGGVCTSTAIHYEAMIQPESSATGALEAQYWYDSTTTATVDVLVKSGESGPDIGDTFQVGGSTMYVKDVEVTESNSSYRKIHVSLERYSAVDKIEEVQAKEAACSGGVNPDSGKSGKTSGLGGWGSGLDSLGGWSKTLGKKSTSGLSK